MSPGPVASSEVPQRATYESARDGTVYWTMSLYVEAGSVQDFCAGHELTPELFRTKQFAHMPSFALRNAIDPLFNDIADRESLGKPRDFLFAAGLGAQQRGKDGTLRPWSDLKAAGAAVRARKSLLFCVPPAFEWTTEGVTFECQLPDVDTKRKVDLRRFWFAHSNGALSYHLSFSHCYAEHGARADGVQPAAYGPETYYFISLLQKLAAPKEFALKGEKLEKVMTSEVAGYDPFAAGPDGELGIDPLDKLLVEVDNGGSSRFWPFVRRIFSDDAQILFEQVLGVKSTARDYGRLITSVDFTEVPGLRLPRSRFMFHIQDRRFFDRLLPVDPIKKVSVPRKRMVQDFCYLPYREQLDGLIHPPDSDDLPERVVLGKALWKWVAERPEYVDAIGRGCFRAGNKVIANISELEQAMHAGTCVQVATLVGKPGAWQVEKLQHSISHDVPAFAPGRPDCLDYLFLSGFNQNIIDFMNQDTSEILDSLDPIYPTGDIQADERFFVRYANHRGMITYVPHSRSLEIGNDYIGTCPYAFLIHVLAMHNEFLARGHERHSRNEIKEIDEALPKRPCDFDGLEQRINDVKRANYWDFERHRYQNVFRYDTERDVFAKLETLRGIDRRTEALGKAIEALEDSTNDLERRQRERQEEESTARQQGFNATVGAVGLLSALSLLFNIADFFEDQPKLALPGPDWGERLYFVLSNLSVFLSIAALLMIAFLARKLPAYAWKNWAKIEKLFSPPR